MNRSEALDASLSAEYTDRIAAAEFLSAHTDDAACSALLRLLLDSDDTGVTQRAAEVLVARNDSYGAILVFAGLALADAEQADTILRVISPAWKMGTFAVEDHARNALAGANPWARFGAQRTLSWLHLSSETGWLL